jgi:hypothetical protein
LGQPATATSDINLFAQAVEITVSTCAALAWVCSRAENVRQQQQKLFKNIASCQEGSGSSSSLGQ